MNPDEYSVLARAEEDHWWYLGLRDVMARSLRRPDLALPAQPRVLDAGCGTGGNLRLLRALLGPSYLGGFDASPHALELARKKVDGADLYLDDFVDLQRVPEALDLVISMDVLCIPGVARARPGLQRLAEALRPGGLFMLHLPAYRWLYSEHDLAVHTSERYLARDVVALLQGLGLDVVLESYRLFFLLPAVALARFPRRVRGSTKRESVRSDLQRAPVESLNRLLLSVLKLENRLIAQGTRFPWGSSVFAVGRKP